MVFLILVVPLGLCIGESDATSSADYSVNLTSNTVIDTEIPLSTQSFTIECTMSGSETQVPSVDSHPTVVRMPFIGYGSQVTNPENISAVVTSVEGSVAIVTITIDSENGLNAYELYKIAVCSKAVYFLTAGSTIASVSVSDLSDGAIDVNLADGDTQAIWISGLGTTFTLDNNSQSWITAEQKLVTRSAGIAFIKLSLSGIEAGTYGFTITGSDNVAHAVSLNIVDGSQLQIVKHHVTYALDGGSGTVPTQEDVAEEGTFTVQSYDGTKDGFTFGGWNDGTNTYNAGAIYTMGTSDVTLTAIWNDIPATFDYDVTGSQAALASELSISVNSYNIKWLNSMGVKTTGGTVDDSSITVKINGEVSSDIGVSIDRATESTNYAVIHLVVKEQLPIASVITVSVNNQTGQLFSMGSVASVTIYVAGYSEGTVDLSGGSTDPLELDAAVCSTGIHYITIRGVTSVPSEIACAGIVFDIPEAYMVSSSINNGFVQIPISTDRSLINGLHEVTVVMGNVTHRFNVNIVNGTAPVTSHDQDYVLSIQLNETVSDSANVVLDVEVQKSANAANLDDMRLLVVAKYSGEYYVFNFYSKPVMDGNNGTDRVVLSKQNLSCVIVEVVDGIQTLDVTFYGVGTYTV